LEHILPSDAAEHLAEYLGKPIVSPAGKPIPEPQSEGRLESGKLLSQLQVGERGRVTRVQADSATRRFMAAEGLYPKTQITITAIGSEGSRLVSTGEGHTINLAAELSNLIHVDKIGPDD
jgi:Fe2+ transport system protein FeoA